jgi:hypothetical protein
VKVDVRTLEGEPMTASAATLPVGSELRIAPAFQATAELEDAGVALTVSARYDAAEGRYVATRVTADASREDVEVNSRLMRALPIGRVVQAAAPHCITLTLEDSSVEGATWIPAAELSSTEGRIIPVWIAEQVIRHGGSDARMDVVEILYGTAALAGNPPTKLIQDELGVPHRTASDWIRKARAAGRLQGMNYPVGRQGDG